MEKKEPSPKMLRKRKALLLLPLPFVLCAAAFFAALGGGKGNYLPGKAAGDMGINRFLPEAHFKKGKEKDKLALYDEAARDSAKRLEAKKKDPFYAIAFRGRDSLTAQLDTFSSLFGRRAAAFGQPLNTGLLGMSDHGDLDANEKKLQQQLGLLKAVLSKKETPFTAGVPNPALLGPTTRTDPDPAVNTGKIQSEQASRPDAEMGQINSMLDKVMLIQHPEKMQDSMLRLSETNKGKSYLVKRQEDTSIFSLMGSRGNGSKENRFYGLDDELGTPALQNTLLGIIPEKQILTTGATVKIRLLADILVSKTLVPRGQFIYGTASLNNERLKINISSIACNKLILPVSLSVYDLDGMEGIYVPGSIDRDASKQSASDAVNTLGLASPDASFGAQAASVGIEAAKTLMSKKIRLVRVTLKEGYQILLKDNNQK